MSYPFSVLIWFWYRRTSRSAVKLNSVPSFRKPLTQFRSACYWNNLPSRHLLYQFKDIFQVRAKLSCWFFAQNLHHPFSRYPNTFVSQSRTLHSSRQICYCVEFRHVLINTHRQQHLLSSQSCESRYLTVRTQKLYKTVKYAFITYL